jgi:hypothetical protein
LASIQARGIGITGTTTTDVTGIDPRALLSLRAARRGAATLVTYGGGVSIMASLSQIKVK